MHRSLNSLLFVNDRFPHPVSSSSPPLLLLYPPQAFVQRHDFLPPWCNGHRRVEQEEGGQELVEWYGMQAVSHHVYIHSSYIDVRAFFLHTNVEGNNRAQEKGGRRKRSIHFTAAASVARTQRTESMGCDLEVRLCSPCILYVCVYAYMYIYINL